MSQFTTEDIARQVSAFSVTTSPILNNYSGICTTATQNRGSFHHLLVFFLKTAHILSILARLPKVGLGIGVDVLQAGHTFSHSRMHWIAHCRKERVFSF